MCVTKVLAMQNESGRAGPPDAPQNEAAEPRMNPPIGLNCLNPGIHVTEEFSIHEYSLSAGLVWEFCYKSAPHLRDVGSSTMRIITNW
jgi:hypothetical protein